jgi:hypothetical protein
MRKIVKNSRRIAYIYKPKMTDKDALEGIHRHP